VNTVTGPLNLLIRQIPIIALKRDLLVGRFHPHAELGHVGDGDGDGTGLPHLKCSVKSFKVRLHERFLQV
jgi:hypothetical protein